MHPENRYHTDGKLYNANLKKKLKYRWKAYFTKWKIIKYHEVHTSTIQIENHAREKLNNINRKYTLQWKRPNVCHAILDLIKNPGISEPTAKIFTVKWSYWGLNLVREVYWIDCFQH